MKCALSLALAMALPGLAMAADPMGVWQTETNKKGAYLHVAIEPCAQDAAKVCGRIVKTVNGSKSVDGKMIIRDMVPKGENKWGGGTIWAPDDDKTYRSKMALTGAGLKVEGCVAVFCRGQTWTRVK